MQDVIAKIARANPMAALLLAILQGACLASPHESVWADEQWGFEISIGAHGWELEEPTPSNDMAVVMAAGPREAAAEGASCQLEYGSRREASAHSRADLNATAHRLLHGPAMEAARSRQTVQRAEVNEVGGVAVLDIHSRVEDQQTILRQFWLLRDGELRGYKLMCLAHHQDAAGIQGMEAVAASLRFWEQQQ